MHSKRKIVICGEDRSKSKQDLLMWNIKQADNIIKEPLSWLRKHIKIILCDIESPDAMVLL